MQRAIEEKGVDDPETIKLIDQYEKARDVVLGADTDNAQQSTESVARPADNTSPEVLHDMTTKTGFSPEEELGETFCIEPQVELRKDLVATG